MLFLVLCFFFPGDNSSNNINRFFYDWYNYFWLIQSLTEKNSMDLKRSPPEFLIQLFLTKNGCFDYFRGNKHPTLKNPLSFQSLFDTPKHPKLVTALYLSNTPRQVLLYAHYTTAQGHLKKC